MLSSSHRLTILLSHLNIKSLRRYQALYDQLPTKSLKTLKAFHSKDASSLASHLLQSAEKTVFEKGMTSREIVRKILNQEQFTIDNEWSDQQLRQASSVISTKRHQYLLNGLNSARDIVPL